MFQYIFYQLNNSYSITIKYLESRSSLCLRVVVTFVLIMKKEGCLIRGSFCRLLRGNYWTEWVDLFHKYLQYK